MKLHYILCDSTFFNEKNCSTFVIKCGQYVSHLVTNKL